jgi:hypothetical protein
VLAVYERLNHRNAVIPADLNDENWSRGMGTFDSVFLLPRTNVAALGYASNELLPGQKIQFSLEDDGESRTITKTEVNDRFLLVYYSGKIVGGSSVGFPNPVKILTNDDSKRYRFEPYKAQYGLQGAVYSFAYRCLGNLSSVGVLQTITATMFALVLLLVCYEYAISLSGYFGAALFFSMICSPWIVSIARNMYWMPFLWILPALITLWLFRFNERPAVRKQLYLAYFVSVFIKSLTGYEYLPTIVMFSLAIFIVDPFNVNPRYSFLKAARIVLQLFILSVAAFASALILHASIRADSIIEGLEVTYQIDAFKYSNLSALGTTSKGIEKPLGEVLITYVFNWNTPALSFFNNDLTFLTLIVLATLSIAMQYMAVNKFRHRDFALIITTMLAPLSWFVLMKGHSAIHVHLNYVLWYMGFVPALVFVGFRGAAVLPRAMASSSPKSTQSKK